MPCCQAQRAATLPTAPRKRSPIETQVEARLSTEAGTSPGTGPGQLQVLVEALAAAVRTAGSLQTTGLSAIGAFRGMRPRQLQRVVRAATESGVVNLRGTELTPGQASSEAALDQAGGTATSSSEADRRRPLRIVAIDFESVVRTVAAKPYLERRAFQVGALRFGRDRRWVYGGGESRHRLSRFCTLPEDAGGVPWQIHSPEVAARHAAEAVGAEIWLAELDAVLDGADVVVAYNGLELDFPLLDDERRRAGLPGLSGVELVDGLLLAQSVWPNPPNSHRLRGLAERLELNVDGLMWHDAAGDCTTLAMVCVEAARAVRQQWDRDLTDLVLTVTTSSPTWGLVADLAQLTAVRRAFSAEQVAGLVGSRLEEAGVPRRRRVRAPGTAPQVDLDGVVVRDGRVDPGLLAARLHGHGPERRAQTQMATLVSRWMAEGHGGLVEAPTGTGKSLVLLAQAMDWVAGSPRRRAIIATHTRQLQAQLAEDVQQLADRGVGVLGEHTDLVKGATNRLSLRALVLELADATEVTDGDGRVPAPVELRELAVYLLTRLVSTQSLTERWLARSVDRSDVPMVFATTCGRRFGAWLRRLSQHGQGDYRADSEIVATLHTDRVPEAIRSARIVIANHALLLAHRNELDASDGGHGTGTRDNGDQATSDQAGADDVAGEVELAIFVDEAHELESAATEALSATFDYQTLERIPDDVGRLLSEADDHPALAAAAETAQRLRRFLFSAVFATSAERVLHQLSEPGAEPGQRTATIASPYVGRRPSAPTEAMRASLEAAQRYLQALHRSLAWWAADSDGLGGADRWAAERFYALASSVTAQEDAVAALVADLDLLLGPLRRPVRRRATPDDPDVPAPDATHEAALEEAIERRGVQQSLFDGAQGADTQAADSPGIALRHQGGAPIDASPSSIEDRAFVEGADSDPGASLLEDGASLLEDTDAEEDADDDGHPGLEEANVQDEIEARADPDSAPGSTNAVVWIAETESPGLAFDRRQLRFTLTSSPISLGAVPAWQDFLARTARIVFTSGTLCAGGDFDYVRDRLGLATDVPAAALDSPFTFATQARLVCFSDFPSWAEHPTRAIRSVAHQVARWSSLTSRGTPDGGLEGGSMVLTTSRAAAAAISEAAAPLLAAAQIPLATTELLGNTRALERFVADGGVVVGTRGLWQGVNVRDPARLRLVWVNKLPFAPFADPVIAARRARSVERARDRGADDPDRAGDEAYYLPLAALGFRQAVGRLIRSDDHRGVVVVSDPKLAGNDPRRRLYRRVFLGSLEGGFRTDDGADLGAGNVTSMLEGWRRAITFGVDQGFIDQVEAEAATTDEAMASFVDLPDMLAVRAQLLDASDVEELAAGGKEAFLAGVLERCEAVASVLAGEPRTLHDAQRLAIAAIAGGRDLMALLPTGFGKSYCYQLPALVLPGVTLVVSPLVSLMVDQAVGLGSVIGPMVRALTGPMAESNSRRGKTEVAEVLRGEQDHGIRLVYVSPERLVDSRFRALVAEAVANGVVTRIAVDEAHCLVDWGDDFRPSYRRLDQFLADLKHRHPGLQLSALTATANATVKEGLRRRLFGLEPAVPAGGDPERFCLVEATPLRPELAIWRRRLEPGGPNAVAGVTEAVVDALRGHAIFYCLTVKEVEVLYASLRDYLGDHDADRVLRYHGRMSSAEKKAVGLAFKTAPREEDAEEFRPLIVVATSAFGLGVDREDVRAVFCVSPPTDLGALFQQLGRAGRDSTHRVPGEDVVPLNATMALLTQRSWRTLAWMATQDLARATLHGVADQLLGAAAPGDWAVVDADVVAAQQLEDDVAAKRLAPDAVFSARRRDQYRQVVPRVLATLSATGALEDLGDIPDRVRVSDGEVRCDEEVWRLVLAGALAAEPPAPDPGGGPSGALARGDVDVVGLHRALASGPTRAVYLDACPTPAELWVGLAAAHDYGWADVSQQSTRRHLSVIRPLVRTRPLTFDREVTARARRVAAELATLRRWFDDTECAQVGFAGAFGLGTVPPGTCATAEVRCSAHWGDPEAAAAAPVPDLYKAFFTPRPRASAATAEGRAAFERRLRRHLSELLWMHVRGLKAPMVRRVLHGEDAWYDQTAGRWRRLWPSLLHHRSRGAMRGVRLRAVVTGLDQLIEAGKVVALEDGRYRWREHVVAEAERADREAARRLRASTPPSAPPLEGAGAAP